MCPWSLEIHTNLVDIGHETEKILSNVMITIFKYMLQFLSLSVDVANYNSKFKLDTVLERLVVVIEESYLEAVVETKWHYHSRRQVQRLVPETVIIMFIIQIQSYLQNYYYDTFLLQNRNF